MKKQNIEDIQKELDALKAITPQAREKGKQAPMPQRQQRYREPDHSDPEICNLEKYPLTEDELSGWGYDATHSYRIKMALTVRQMLHDFKVRTQ
jgi:hypothetical protein